MKVIKKDQVWNTASVKNHSWASFGSQPDREAAEEAELLEAAEKVEEKEHQAVIEKVIEAKKVEREVTNLKSKSEEIIAEAKKKAENEAQAIIDQAQRQVEDIKQQGFQKGLQDGTLQAEKEVQQKYEELFSQEVAKVKDIVTAVEASYQEIIKESEDKIVKLSLDIAKKILKEECKKKSSVVLNMVREGLSRIVERTAVKIRLNPQQLPGMEKNRNKLLKEFGNVEGIELISDSGVVPGGCVVETSSGSIDLRINRQFGEIERNLTGQPVHNDEFESDA